MMSRVSYPALAMPPITMKHLSMGVASAVTACMLLYLVIPNNSLGSKSLNPAELFAVLKRSQQRLEYTRRAIADVSWRPKDVVLMTHRGCVQRYPENSLAAIAACSEEGSHVVEIDVALTRDGHAVLLHDKTLSRTTNRRTFWNQTTLVGNLTLKEVQSNYWLVQKEDTNTLTSFRIPTFVEALQVARSCGIHLYVDTKKRSYLERAILKDMEREDAFDYVMLTDIKTTPLPMTPEAAEKVRIMSTLAVLDNTTALSANKHRYPASFYITGPLRQMTRELCQLRERTKTAVTLSMLWEKGEYYLRDPELARMKFPLHYAGQSFTHEPCVGTHDAEEPCLGAHLYQPLTKATCARILMHENPMTARAALSASRQMAPSKRFPLETIRFFQKGVRHANIPACLEAWEQSRKETNGVL